MRHVTIPDFKKTVRRLINRSRGIVDDSLASETDTYQMQTKRKTLQKTRSSDECILIPGIPKQISQNQLKNRRPTQTHCIQKSVLRFEQPPVTSPFLHQRPLQHQLVPELLPVALQKISPLQRLQTGENSTELTRKSRWSPLEVEELGALREEVSLKAGILERMSEFRLFF